MPLSDLRGGLFIWNLPIFWSLNGSFDFEWGRIFSRTISYTLQMVVHWATLLCLSLPSTMTLSFILTCSEHQSARLFQAMISISILSCISWSPFLKACHVITEKFTQREPSALVMTCCGERVTFPKSCKRLWSIKYWYRVVGLNNVFLSPPRKLHHDWTGVVYVQESMKCNCPEHPELRTVEKIYLLCFSNRWKIAQTSRNYAIQNTDVCKCFL